MYQYWRFSSIMYFNESSRALYRTSQLRIRLYIPHGLHHLCTYVGGYLKCETSVSELVKDHRSFCHIIIFTTVFIWSNKPHLAGELDISTCPHWAVIHTCIFIAYGAEGVWELWSSVLRFTDSNFHWTLNDRLEPPGFPPWDLFAYVSFFVHCIVAARKKHWKSSCTPF